ncbi:hypothetical protein DFH94DRAFT_33741 [Russula ochroleuca]|jgi:hypothetical protein|uniref:Uncharacterized protein n=1 Tax=Russula ochroleuca TaxID=152965 RepID=A0A9P5T7I6_9AGAM|nr:hypothetical protein DFH94DRAFT_33741 [Russula ochroleuca]
MYNSCTVGAPGIWARAIRVFIEGIVAFGLGAFIYVGHLSFQVCAFGANLNAFMVLFFSGTWTVPVPGPPLPYDPAAVSTGKGILRSMRPEVRSCSRISSLNNHPAFLPTNRAGTYCNLLGVDRASPRSALGNILNVCPIRFPALPQQISHQRRYEPCSFLILSLLMSYSVCLLFHVFFFLLKRHLYSTVYIFLSSVSIIEI